MQGKVTISHPQTKPFKYLQSSILVIWIIIELISGNNTDVIIPLAFLILSCLINVFVVEASVDKDAIYVRQWIKEIKYPLDQIDKIAEVKGGLTSLSVLTEKGSLRHFLILSSPDLFRNPEQADVYDFLLKLKMDYMRRQKEVE